MGKQQYDCNPNTRALYARVSERLDFDIAKIIFSDEAKLNSTKYTQPAIVLTSFVLATNHPDKLEPDYLAGHSVGEYTALAYAGCMSILKMQFI